MENSNQFYNLNESEMLALWKQLMHLDTPRRDCAVEGDDGVDIDALLTTHIKQWYAQLLNTAPCHLLPVQDVKSDVLLQACIDGTVEATPPQYCVRPVEWRLNGWERSVTTFLEPSSREAMVQLNKWTRGRACNPAVIDYGSRLLLVSAAVTPPQLITARCVVRPASGTYQFHASLLNTIPTIETVARG